MLALFSWCCTLALAIEPPEVLPHDFSPAITRTFPAYTQQAGAAQPAWQAFRTQTAPGWEAIFTPRTPVPWRMMGPPLAHTRVSSEAEAAGLAMRFAHDHADLLGLSDLQIRLKRTGVAPNHTMFYVDLETLRDDIPVWQGEITFRFTREGLIQVGAHAWPDAQVEGGSQLDAAQAVQSLLSSHDFFATHGWTLQDTSLVWLTSLQRGKPVQRLTWLVRGETDGTRPGHWRAFIDAQTGEVTGLLNDVLYASGTLSAEIDTRELATEIVPLSFVNVSGSGSQPAGLSDADGEWEVDDDPPYSTELRGPSAYIVDELGNIRPLVDEGPYLLSGQQPGDVFAGHQAALTAFLSVQRAKAVASGFAADVPWVNGLATHEIHVNINDSCNAYFDGALNFFREGGGCRNTGRLPDVVYHEWGHGLHYYSLQSGVFDASLSEGAADVFAMIVTGDHALSPGFFLNRPGALRDMRNDNRYPRDYRMSAGADPHANGMIFSGALWDLRERLESDLGANEGFEVFKQIYAGILRGGTDIPGSYTEAVAVDVSLYGAAGKPPHLCAIIDAFGAHGLGPIGGFGLGVTHTPETTAPYGLPLPVHFEVADPAPDCLNTTPTGGTLHWRADGGAWQDLPLSAQGAHGVQAEIPMQELPMGSIVEYWAEIATTQGSAVLAPSQGEIRPRTLYVGDVIPLHCNDFEEDDGGFTHELVRGLTTEGADDWMWGRPRGFGGDPAHAASGAKVWGTDLGGERNGSSYDGMYQNSKQTRLTALEVGTRHMTGVFLNYNRWLQVEDALYDRAEIYANDTLVWSNYASASEQDGSLDHLDDQWENHSVDLQGVGDDGTVQVAWEITSDAGLGFGGWNIDDVCIFAPATPDNRLGIDDFTLSRTDNEVTFHWTNPRFAPVTKVVIIQGRGCWPQSAEDGKIVFELDDPTLGAPETATVKARGEHLYYAIYASDGTDWLGWTRRGYNAAGIDPEVCTPKPASKGGARACGCAQGLPPTSPSGWALLGGLWFARRRRSQRAR